MSDPADRPRADIEAGARWQAGSARWHVPARPRSSAFGDVETERLDERPGLPDTPAPARVYRNVGRRWRFSAWLRDPRP